MLTTRSNLVLRAARIHRYAGKVLPQETSLEKREYDLPVPWGHLAVKEWGPANGDPVLCMHGWLDSVSSFDRLVPLLPSHLRYVAFDFSGHGWSSHRPPGTFYGLAEYTSDAVRVVETLGLRRFPIVGHSLGARMAFVFSTLYPDKVTKVVALDEANPYVLPIEEQFKGLGLVVREAHAYEMDGGGEPRTYPRQEALDRMVKGGMGPVAAETLFDRCFKQVDLAGGGEPRFALNRDVRIRGRHHFVLLSNDVLNHMNKAYCKDLLLMLSSRSVHQVIQDPDGSFRKAYANNCSDYRFVRVDGSHFAHIEEPNLFVPHITRFFDHGIH